MIVAVQGWRFRAALVKPRHALTDCRFAAPIPVAASVGYTWTMSRISQDDDLPAQHFHVSKIKMALLILPCLLGVGAALQMDDASRFALADYRWVNAAAVVICLFVAALLARMALEKEPVLVLDANGLHCRRPPVGSIPWSAVIGIGAGKAALMRRVLMVAVDQQQLDADGREYIKNSLGALSLISPQLSKFGRYAQGYPSVHIPISLFSTSPSQVERAVQEFVNHYIVDDDN
jgi:hypothetical protein